MDPMDGQISIEEIDTQEVPELPRDDSRKAVHADEGQPWSADYAPENFADLRGGVSGE